MDGDRSPGEKGREAGEERARSGSSKMARTSEEKLRKFRNILLYFALEIEQGGANHYEKGREAGVKVTGRGRKSMGSGSFRLPCPSH